MADDLNIGRHFFHFKNRKLENSKPRPHYDIPANRIAEIREKCDVVSRETILLIIKKWRIEHGYE